MKKLLICFVVLFLIDSSFPGEKKIILQKFKMVATITFNEVTLEEAANLERVIKSQFSSACKIEVKMAAIEDVDSVSIMRGYMYWNNIRYFPDTAYIDPTDIDSL